MMSTTGINQGGIVSSDELKGLAGVLNRVTRRLQRRNSGAARTN